MIARINQILYDKHQYFSHTYTPVTKKSTGAFSKEQRRHRFIIRKIFLVFRKVCFHFYKSRCWLLLAIEKNKRFYKSLQSKMCEENISLVWINYVISYLLKITKWCLKQCINYIVSNLLKECFKFKGIWYKSQIKKNNHNNYCN